MTKKARYEKVIEYFKKNMPVAETELVYTNPYELMVSVILSAQCTDKRVNMITPGLFKKFRDSKAMSMAKQEEVFELIKSCSYPNNKAKHLIGMAKTLEENFDGIVPSDIDELQKIPGIGRKSANVIASVIYNQPRIAVDTHVFRVAARIGLSTHAKTPLQTENQLMQYIPEELRPLAHHWLILHGRYVCLARNPRCQECGLIGYCKFYHDKNNKRLS